MLRPTPGRTRRDPQRGANPKLPAEGCLVEGDLERPVFPPLRRYRGSIPEGSLRPTSFKRLGGRVWRNLGRLSDRIGKIVSGCAANSQNDTREQLPTRECSSDQGKALRTFHKIVWPALAVIDDSSGSPRRAPDLFPKHGLVRHPDSFTTTSLIIKCAIWVSDLDGRNDSPQIDS